MSEIEGIETYARFVQEINQHLPGKIIRRPVTRSLRVFANEMKARAPRGKRRRRKRGTPISRRLWQAHGIRFRGAKRIVGKAGVNVAKKRSQRAPHAHLIGLGTVERVTKAGAKRGRVTPNPYVRQSVVAKQHEAQDVLFRGIWEEVEKVSRNYKGRT